MVIHKAETKVAQYGQWDGYPSGQGSTIVEFLKSDENVKNLKSNLDRCRFIEDDGRDKEFMDSYNKNAPEWSNDPDNRTEEQKRWFDTFMTRNLGGDILSKIANSSVDEILIRDSSSFAADSLMNEWSYVIDFDKNVLEVYTGFNTSPLADGERFKNLESLRDGKYYPITLKKSFPLDDLPTEEEFCNQCDPSEESEEE